VVTVFGKAVSSILDICLSNTWNNHSKQPDLMNNSKNITESKKNKTKTNEMKKRNIHDYSEDIGLDASRNVWTKLNTLVTNYETKHVADNGCGAEQRSFFLL
jgi:hypothetical protein